MNHILNFTKYNHGVPTIQWHIPETSPTNITN